MRPMLHRLTVVSLLGASLWLGGCVMPGDYSAGSTTYIPVPVVVPVPRYRTVYVPRYAPRYVYTPRDPVRGYYPSKGLGVR